MFDSAQFITKSEPIELANNDSKPLAARNVVQVAVIVRDVEKAAKAWASLVCSWNF